MERLLADLNSQMPRGNDGSNPRVMATLDGPMFELDDPLGCELGSMQGRKKGGSSLVPSDSKGLASFMSGLDGLHGEVMVEHHIGDDHL